MPAGQGAAARPVSADGGASAARPTIPPGLALAAAVFAVSWSGPLVRLTSAPSLAIATWRLILSIALVALILAVRGGEPRVALRTRDRALALLAGGLLAAHFWSWITSLEYTSVASSVVLVSTQPIFAAVLSSILLRETPTRRQWLGIVIAVSGAMLIGWGDLGRGPRPLVGDLLALGGAVFGSGYFVIGRSLRPLLGLWSYIAVVYGIAAGLLLLAAIGTATPLLGYAPADWAIFALLALGPMMIGHTGVNYALRYVTAYVANLALLGEAVGATLLAWILPSIHEVPPAQTLIGGAVTLLGIALGVRARRARVPGGHGREEAAR